MAKPTSKRDIAAEQADKLRSAEPDEADALWASLDTSTSPDNPDDLWNSLAPSGQPTELLEAGTPVVPGGHVTDLPMTELRAGREQPAYVPTTVLRERETGADRSMLATVARNVAQGATLGGGDELAAASLGQAQTPWEHALQAIVPQVVGGAPLARAADLARLVAHNPDVRGMVGPAVESATGGLINMHEGDPLGSMEQVQGSVRDTLARDMAQHPVASTASQIAGGALPGMVAAPFGVGGAAGLGAGAGLASGETPRERLALAAVGGLAGAGTYQLGRAAAGGARALAHSRALQWVSPGLARAARFVSRHLAGPADVPAASADDAALQALEQGAVPEMVPEPTTQVMPTMVDTVPPGRLAGALHRAEAAAPRPPTYAPTELNSVPAGRLAGVRDTGAEQVALGRLAGMRDTGAEMAPVGRMVNARDTGVEDAVLGRLANQTQDTAADLLPMGRMRGPGRTLIDHPPPMGQPPAPHPPDTLVSPPPTPTPPPAPPTTQVSPPAGAATPVQIMPEESAMHPWMASPEPNSAVDAVMGRGTSVTRLEGRGPLPPDLVREPTRIGPPPRLGPRMPPAGPPQMPGNPANYVQLDLPQYRAPLPTRIQPEYAPAPTPPPPTPAPRATGRAMNEALSAAGWIPRTGESAGRVLGTEFAAHDYERSMRDPAWQRKRDEILRAMAAQE